MLRLTLASVISMMLATAVLAQSVAPVDTLIRALGLPQILDVMREEGLGYGEEMQQDLLQGRGGDRWPALVSEIYNTDLMAELLRRRLDSELAAEDLAPMIAFFLSDIGKRIVTLEVSARETLLDPQIEEISKQRFSDLKRDGADRVEMLEDFALAGDLIENNVVGALNSNYAFYVGMVEGGAFAEELSEEQILADVWAQEGAIREDTTLWLYSYLNMAYQPLTDEELEEYTAFFESDAGRVLNQAIFAAFDDVFSAISLALGQAASQFMAGQEL